MRSTRCLTQPEPARRSGTTLIEVVAAGAILAVLLIVCAQMLTRTAVQQQAIANRRAALEMAANAMERARAIPWEDLNAASLGPIAQAVAGQAVAGQAMLRGSRIDVTVDEPESDVPAKRIRVTVDWREQRDGEQRTQKLTAWRFAEGLPERKVAATPNPPNRAEEQK